MWTDGRTIGILRGGEGVNTAFGLSSAVSLDFTSTVRRHGALEIAADPCWLAFPSMYRARHIIKSKVRCRRVLG